MDSHFFRRRSQFDDFVFRWLADDVFVFLSGGDACEFGIDLVVFRDFQDRGAILDDPREEVGPSRNLEDVLDVRKIILCELVVLLQVAEPLSGRGDVVALVFRDVLFTGGLQLLQVLISDVLREVSEQRAVLRHRLLRCLMRP